MSITFRVPGRPVPMGRGRCGKDGSVYLPPTTKRAKEAIQWAFKGAHPGHELLTGRLSVRIAFVLIKRGTADVDNLVKTVLDAGNGVIWKDDRQIDFLEAGVYVDAVHEPETIISVDQEVRFR